MASGFFQKAKDKATEAAAGIQAYAQQQQQSKHEEASPDSTDNPDSNSNTNTNTNSNSNPHSTGRLASYTSAVPHLFRSSIASVDPRFESTRSFHVLSTSLKNISIDHAALARENKSAAKATFRFGQDHVPGKREDGVGDAALVDITDRLAYVLSTIGDLHLEHSKRSELARGELKQVRAPEKSLASSRTKRVQIKKELAGLVPERAKKDSTAKVAELEAQWNQLESEAQEDEERIAQLKRTAVRDGYEGLFDSLIELGEKLALISRYGKLLTHTVPVGESPEFPSTIQHLAPGQPSWAGAAKVAEIRRSIEPALKNYQPIVKVPEVFDTLNPTAVGSDSTPTVGNTADKERVTLQDAGQAVHQTSAPPIHSSAASIVSNQDATSYAVSHAEELGDDSNEIPMENQDPNHRTSFSDMEGGRPNPLPQGGSLPPNLNMSPTFSSAGVNASASPSAKHRVPPLPNPEVAPPLPAGAQQPPTPNPSDLNLPSSSFGTSQNLPPSQSVQHLANSKSEQPASAPDDPTYAETGKPIHGPGGPKSGTLGTPRRPSNLSNSERPSSSSLTGGAAAHSQYQSKAQEAEAEREQNRRQQSGGDGLLSSSNENVTARVRRDGTVVRRGDADFQKAEEEGLPVYQAVEGQAGLSEAANVALQNERNGGKSSDSNQA